MSVLKISLRLSYRVKNSIFKRYSSNDKVRVRFAPSPTGYLHLGGLRTALYNHLFAKSKNGVSILRIEDTDLSRKVESATENIIEDLAWCGIVYDEGPYFQSERLDIYKKYIDQLLDQGDAYYCFCSNTRLNLLRKEALKAGEVSKYDNKCRHLSKSEVNELLKTENSPCVRFKLSHCDEKINDIIHGPFQCDVAAVEGDPVIFKADGYPTYHFANVVDDHLMNITHVLRGVEWQISTHKHLLIYKALKWKPPLYAHLPLLLNPDGTKLSKRQGDVHIKSLREAGYLSNAVINFIIRFGGGFDFDQSERSSGLIPFEELVQKFNLTKVKPSSCKVSLNDLNEYNRMEIIRLLETEDGLNTLVKESRELLKKHIPDSKADRDIRLGDEHIKLMLEVMKKRICRLQDLVSKDYEFFWVWENTWNSNDEVIKKAVEKLCLELETVNWDLESLKNLLHSFVKENNLKLPKLMKNLRVILTGYQEGLSVAELMELLGRNDVLYRLTSALKKNSKRKVSDQS